MKKKKRKHLKEAEFKKIKKLLVVGVPIKFVAEITSRHASMVHKVNKVADWAEYVEKKKEYAQKVLGRQNEKPQVTPDLKEELASIKKTLERIEELWN